MLVALGTSIASMSACTPSSSAHRRGHAPITTSSTSALKAFLKGRDLLDNLRGAEGRNYFLKAVKLDPGFAMAHLYLAQTAATTGDLFPALRRAVELADSATPAEAHVIRAFEAGVNNQPAVQREHLEALVKSFPDDERVQNRLGNFFFGRQEWPEAISAYEKAIRINPDFAPAYNLLGYSLRNLGRLDEASKAFCTYMKLIPDEPNPYDSHAELLLLMGKYPDAVIEYQRALAINPNFADSYIGMGNAYLMQGDFVSARNAFTALRFIAVDDGQRRQASLWLATTALHQGRQAEAIELIRQDIEVSRRRDDLFTAADGLNLMANVLLEAGEIDRAVGAFQESLQAVESAVITRDLKETARRTAVYIRTRVALARHDSGEAATLAAEYCQQVEAKAIPFELRRCHELRGLVALAAGDATTAQAQLSGANLQDPRVLFALALAYQAGGQAGAYRETLSRVVNFNALSLQLGLVRPRALALLAAEEKASGPPI